MNKIMLVAIPTINKKLITRRFGRMTEITFLEIENYEVKRQFLEIVTSIHNHHNKEDEKQHQKRHQEIEDKICRADIIVYKSLCKNWRIRLQNCPKILKKTNNDLLIDIIEEIKKM